MDAATASPAVFDLVGALLIAYAMGSMAVAKTGCQMCMTMFTGAIGAACVVLVQNENMPEAAHAKLQKYTACMCALAFMHMCSPFVSKKLGTPKPKYTGYA